MRTARSTPTRQNRVQLVALEHLTLWGLKREKGRAREREQERATENAGASGLYSHPGALSGRNLREGKLLGSRSVIPVEILGSVAGKWIMHPSEESCGNAQRAHQGVDRDQTALNEHHTLSVVGFEVARENVGGL